VSEADRDKWDCKYSSPDNAPREPSQVLIGLERYLPRGGTALELAGGAGRNAIWLASRGLDVTIWDISTVGLALARERAQAAGVKLATESVDLEHLSPEHVRQFDLVLSMCYLNRPLLKNCQSLLAPDGTLIVIQPTRRNLERHDKPPYDYLLADGELPSLVTGLEIMCSKEGWLADGRHDAVLVARRRS
jgi:SAM-dependent methyltransferase